MEEEKQEKKRENRKLPPEKFAAKVYSQYEEGIRFNNRINLNDTVENNENFFIGKGLPM